MKKGEFHLQIRDVRLEDGGDYKCKVFGLPPKEATLTVIVPVPQPPTLSGAEVPAQAGQQLELSCTSSGGHPLPQLSWYNGTEAFTERYVRQQQRGGRVEADLILRRVTKWDNGLNLTCRASQPFPEITSARESWMVLQVNYPPSISVPTKSIRAKEGEPAMLTCLVDSHPFASITWTKHGRPIADGGFGKGTFRIPSTSRQDAGIYQCTADNGVLPIAVGTVTLDVLSQLDCAVFADPLPSDLEWLWRNKYGIETELDSAIAHIVTTRGNQKMTSTLTIPDVAVKDGGDYVCKTTNMFGSVMRNIHLEIEGKNAVVEVTDPIEVPASRPMPPVPKYVYKTGTIDSGVEDLELQEMYGTLKPRPPPRMEKKWELVGLSYSGT
uniref:Ig-like domain-containing protein n=1 Tax=Branchiostoma floridae TaxID=7739 RepID=C3ZMB7_BRAFL|eukprot:XP_002590362.1 hypothetical protein BRAFLDRAFT_76635 [Branchiostoma floridae]